MHFLSKPRFRTKSKSQNLFCIQKANSWWQFSKREFFRSFFFAPAFIRFVSTWVFNLCILLCCRLTFEFRICKIHLRLLSTFSIFHARMHFQLVFKAFRACTEQMCQIWSVCALGRTGCFSICLTAAWQIFSDITHTPRMAKEFSLCRTIEIPCYWSQG